MSDEQSGVAPVVEAAPENPVAGASKGSFDPAAVSDDSVDPSTEAPEGDEGTEESDEFVDDGKEPEVTKRKTVQDFIIERKNAKIAKLEAKQEGEEVKEGDDLEGEDPAKAVEEPEEGEGEDPSSEVMQPIVEEYLAGQDAQEVTSFLEENPDFAPYTAKVERLMKHESRRNIPVNDLFYAVAGPNLLKMGAERERQADAEAKGTQSGGGSNREGLAPIDWMKATPEQMEARKLQVRQAR